MKQKKVIKKWYLGLDIGTNSVGFCATDQDYNILTKNSKLQCGSRLFEAAHDASERRLFRAKRRRSARRKERIKLLQDLFGPAISKKDKDFFSRLNESNYHLEDKKVQSKHPLFNDPDYTDKEFYNEFPTIYHLRQSLMKDDCDDPRKLYLACHHLIKYRGHFLFKTFNTKSNENLVTIIESINQNLNNLAETLGIEIVSFEVPNEVDLSKIINDRQASKSLLSEKLNLLLNPQKNSILSTFLKFVKGDKVTINVISEKDKLQNILSVAELDDDFKKELKNFSFASDKFDELFEKLKDLLDDEQIGLIANLKSFHDLISLNRILFGHETIADSMVSRYKLHQEQLKIFKKFIKENCPTKYNEYNEIFRKNVKDIDKNNIHATYPNYIHSSLFNGVKTISHDDKCISTKNKNKLATSASYEDFLDNTKHLLAQILDSNHNIAQNEDYIKIKEWVDNGDFCKKHNLKENSLIPYQLTLKELDNILDKQQKNNNFPFLTEEFIEKLKSILTFKIPYYVGPLSEKHKSESITTSRKNNFAWIVKKSGHEKEKVYPWNFNEIVDLVQSGEQFIKRMTSRCTYLKDEDVLPKESMLYQEYMVLNELNMITINDEKIPQECKEIIYKELCLKGEKLSNSKIEELLIDRSKFTRGKDRVTYKGAYINNLTSYVTFKNILGEQIDSSKYRELCENIILWHTIFGDEKEHVKECIKESHYHDLLTSEQVQKLSKLNFKGWGNLSKKFLTDITITSTDRETVESELSILSLLRHKNLTLDEIKKSYGSQFLRMLEKENPKIDSKINYDYIDKLYCYATVKRSIWQAVKISQELTKINGCKPDKVFIEINRKDDKTIVAKSRKKQLEDKLNATKGKGVTEELLSLKSELLDNLKDYADYQLSDNDKLYLYFTQFGKCMYTGERISLLDLFNENIYDIDHIYPKSKKLDNSLDNRVLVKKIANGHKEDKYPIESNIQRKQKKFWLFLKNHNFISEKKYERLISSQELTDDIINGFTNRQIVSTNQAIKETDRALQHLFGYTSDEEQSRIVYSKAIFVSIFREKFNLAYISQLKLII